jgi:hypothetical protein
LENAENKEGDAVLPCQTVELTGPLSEGKSHEIIIIGTAHVSEKSVQEVTKAIEETKPDIVAVELCPARYKALTGQEEETEIKISELLSGGRLYFFLVQWFLAYIQKKNRRRNGSKTRLRDAGRHRGSQKDRCACGSGGQRCEHNHPALLVGHGIPG